MREFLKVFPLGNWQKIYNQSSETEKPILYKRVSITLGMRNSSEKVIDQLERMEEYQTWRLKWTLSKAVN